MRKYLLKYLPRFLVLAAALFCWYHALILSGDMIKSASSVSIRYGTDGIPCSTVNRMLEEESVPFAAWVQKNNQRVIEQDFSRDAGLQVLEIAGDVELVLPAAELLYGFLPVRGSMDTCAIDAATSYALWGDTDVTGEILICGDREYIVTGVFSRPENTMLVQSSLENGAIFPYLELSVSGTANPGQQADEFRNRYSLSEPDMLTDHVETAAILCQLALLPALHATAFVLWRILRQLFGNHASSLERVGFVAIMAVGVLISAWAIGFSPVIPAAAIPGRWSDFSFWARLIEKAGEGVDMSRALSWPVPDIMWWHRKRSLLLYAGGALAGCMIGLMRKSGTKKRGNIQNDIGRT